MATDGRRPRAVSTATPAGLPADELPMRPFTESLPMALLQAREAAMRLFRPLLADHDLTEQQWRVLRALAAEDAPQFVGQLADATFLLGPSLSRILSNLERRHLIVRERAEHDQRASAISLTLEGRRLVRLIAPQSEDTYALIERAFGRDRLAALLRELHELATLDPSTQPAPREEAS